MRRLVFIALATVAAVALWAAIFLAGTLEGWWRRPLAPAGDPGAFLAAASRMADAERPGAMALVLIEDGRIVGERYISIGEPVDRNTLFQVASLSKWITALGVMTLVEDGRIDLDAPVETYLKRWRLPPGDHDNRGVTVRRLLSHTAGLTDGLGYAGFQPGQPLQPLPESLTRAADASPGRDGVVRVGQPPGDGWRYSGGGYTLLQLLIEDVTGESFEAYMQRAVLQPLAMARSTFVTPAEDAPNLAGFYDEDGGPATHYRFTAAAAAALYTSAADMARLIQAHLPGLDGAAPGRGVLSPQTLEEMRRPHARQMGADIWGLGLILYAPNGAGGHIVGHDGNNEPAINTAARFDPSSGDGIVVLESGAPMLATRLAGEWVFWRTGKVDNFMVLMEARKTVTVLAAGAVLILLAGAMVGWRVRPRRTAA